MSLAQAYKVSRVSEETWIINGATVEGLDAAVKACEQVDTQEFGAEWDFLTYGECRDGLQALRIGESLDVDLTTLFPEE